MAGEDRGQVTKRGVTNNGRGPRLVTTARGGVTIDPGQTKNIDLDEKDVEGLEPYTKTGMLEIGEPLEEADPQEIEQIIEQQGNQASSENPDARPSANQGDIAPLNQSQNSGREGDDNGDDGDDGSDTNLTDGDDSKVVNIQHVGFGRWKGFNEKGEVVTDAMTSQEVDAYIAEHPGVVKGNAPDPDETGSNDGD